MKSGVIALAWSAVVALGTASCGGNLDAGRNVPHGPLPIDERNPLLIVNDGATDNWMGEYAVLIANAGGPRIAGIVVCASNYWTDLAANVTSWTKFVNAARASGFDDVPDLTVSAGSPLAAPADGRVESTVPNESTGAQRILELSRELGSPSRPLVVLVSTQLTDVADAYLMDPEVVDRVIVVANLGTMSGARVLMTGPNGDLDPWADWIVAHRFNYVQITVAYDQSADLSADVLATLPKNSFTDWIAQKQPGLSTNPGAADQLGVLATALPQFVSAADRYSPDAAAIFGSPIGQGPPLVRDAEGNARVVTSVDTALSNSRLSHLLVDWSSHL